MPPKTRKIFWPAGAGHSSQASAKLKKIPARYARGRQALRASKLSLHPPLLALTVNGAEFGAAVSPPVFGVVRVCDARTVRVFSYVYSPSCDAHQFHLQG